MDESALSPSRHVPFEGENMTEREFWRQTELYKDSAIFLLGSYLQFSAVGQGGQDSLVDTSPSDSSEYILSLKLFCTFSILTFE